MNTVQCDVSRYAQSQEMCQQMILAGDITLGAVGIMIGLFILVVTVMLFWALQKGEL